MWDAFNQRILFLAVERSVACLYVHRTYAYRDWHGRNEIPMSDFLRSRTLGTLMEQAMKRPMRASGMSTPIPCPPHTLSALRTCNGYNDNDWQRHRWTSCNGNTPGRSSSWLRSTTRIIFASMPVGRTLRSLTLKYRNWKTVPIYLPISPWLPTMRMC